MLGIPPILANTFVGIHQVDRASVDAARGHRHDRVRDPPQGRDRRWRSRPSSPASAGPRSRSSRRRRSRRSPGLLTLGDFIINENVYGDNGVLAGAILVALLALALEFSLAGLQRLLTSKGLKLRPRVISSNHTQGGTK